jgi:hypothetical protein
MKINFALTETVYLTSCSQKKEEFNNKNIHMHAIHLKHTPCFINLGLINVDYFQTI